MLDIVLTGHPTGSLCTLGICAVCFGPLPLSRQSQPPSSALGVEERCATGPFWWADTPTSRVHNNDIVSAKIDRLGRLKRRQKINSGTVFYLNNHNNWNRREAHAVPGEYCTDAFHLNVKDGQNEQLLLNHISSDRWSVASLIAI